MAQEEKVWQVGFKNYKKYFFSKFQKIFIIPKNINLEENYFYKRGVLTQVISHNQLT